LLALIKMSANNLININFYVINQVLFAKKINNYWQLFQNILKNCRIFKNFVQNRFVRVIDL
jgi:hypothetical protein